MNYELVLQTPFDEDEVIAQFLTKELAEMTKKMCEAGTQKEPMRFTVREITQPDRVGDEE